MDDDYVNSPSDGWRMNEVPCSGVAPTLAPGSCLRLVARASTAHEVPGGEPKRAGASLDARMMRAATRALILPDTHHPGRDSADPIPASLTRYVGSAE